MHTISIQAQQFNSEQQRIDSVLLSMSPYTISYIMHNWGADIKSAEMVCTYEANKDFFDELESKKSTKYSNEDLFNGIPSILLPTTIFYNDKRYDKVIEVASNILDTYEYSTPIDSAVCAYAHHIIGKSQYLLLYSKFPFLQQELIPRANLKSIVNPKELESFNLSADTIYQHIKKAKELYSIIHPQSRHYVSALSLLGQLESLHKNNYAMAQEYVDEAIKIYRYIDATENLEFAILLQEKAIYHYKQNDYIQAIRLFEEVINICEKNNDVKLLQTSYYYTTLCYEKERNYDEAIKSMTIYISKYREVYGEENADYLSGLNKLMLYYNFTEEYAKSIKIGEHCSILTKHLWGKDSEQYTIVIENLGYCHGWLGHIKEAIRYFQECAEIRKETLGSTSISYASAIAHLSFYLSEIGELENAKRLNQEAIKVFKLNGMESSNTYLQTLSSSIRIAYNCENYREGIDLGCKLLDFLQSNEEINSHRIAEVKFNIAKCYTALGETSNAIKYNRESISISQKTSNYRLFDKLEQLDLLQLNYLEAGLDSLYIQTVQEEHNILKEILRMQLHTLTNKDKVAYSEAAHSFYHQLINDLILIREFHSNRFQMILPLKEVIYEGTLLLKDLILNTDKIDTQMENYHISLLEIKEQLGEQDIAIEFINFIDYRYEEDVHSYAAAAIRKEWKEPTIFFLHEEPLYEYGMEKLQDKDSLSINLQRLYNHTWRRLGQAIQPGDNIYFSASGTLYKLPLENLITEDGKIMSDVYHMHRLSSTRELAIKKEPIKYEKAILYGGLNYDMTNDDMLTESNKYQSDSTGIHFASRGLLEDSIRGYKWTKLSNTTQEVEYISDLMKQNKIITQVYQGNKGNEEFFKAISGQGYNIIHLATHGFFYPEQEAQKKDYFQPMLLMQNDLNRSLTKADLSLWRTGLVLSGGNRAWQGDSIPEQVEDGILTANEIKDMDLRNTDLVVLSACQTGQGEVTSEGVFGLQRAFKMAGAKTIVMSLTEVDDQTTMAMMNKFYSNLMEGQSKHDAFYNAQRYIRSIKPDPKYWMGWIMLD